jgi:hypothetical protein
MREDTSMQKSNGFARWEKFRARSGDKTAQRRVEKREGIKRHKAYDRWLKKALVFGRQVVGLAKQGDDLRWRVGDFILTCPLRNSAKPGILSRYIYKELSKAVHIEIPILRDWAWVARSVNASVRTDKLSWNHHRVIAKLDPEKQRQALKNAREKNLSVNDLRKMFAEPKKPVPQKTRRLKQDEASLIRKFRDLLGNDGYHNITTFVEPKGARYHRFEMRLGLEGLQQLYEIFREYKVNHPEVEDQAPATAQEPAATVTEETPELVNA